MTTLLRLGRRRCDGVCHEAEQPECVCLCGGRYHGVGLREASLDLAHAFAYIKPNQHRRVLKRLGIDERAEAVQFQQSLPIDAPRIKRAPKPKREKVRRLKGTQLALI